MENLRPATNYLALGIFAEDTEVLCAVSLRDFPHQTLNLIGFSAQRSFGGSFRACWVALISCDSIAIEFFAIYFYLLLFVIH